MKEISSDETIIEGQWLYDGKEVNGDEACERIKWLTSEVLERVCVDESGWETLYRDLKNNRQWLLYYPQSEIHGGGPPTLKVISDEEVRGKFKA
jgi:Immunity protein 27